MNGDKLLTGHDSPGAVAMPQEADSGLHTPLPPLLEGMGVLAMKWGIGLEYKVASMHG